MTALPPSLIARSCRDLIAEKNAHWQALSSDLLKALVFFVGAEFAVLFDYLRVLLPREKDLDIVEQDTFVSASLQGFVDV